MKIKKNRPGTIIISSIKNNSYFGALVAQLRTRPQTNRHSNTLFYSGLETYSQNRYVPGQPHLPHIITLILDSRLPRNFVHTQTGFRSKEIICRSALSTLSQNSAFNSLANIHVRINLALPCHQNKLDGKFSNIYLNFIELKLKFERALMRRLGRLQSLKYKKNQVFRR